ncbi:MAG: GNAT family N-acetyltransferase [Eubacteriales bacterium]|nr:GNAT family N-acetyltransferase [Eubacteriales bacterium]
MKIVSKNTLTEQDVQSIRALEQASFQKDGLENGAYLSNNLNFNPELPCFYLGYEGDTLAAFLAVFMPDPTEAEIMAATLPMYQQRGFFRQLYERAAEELRLVGIHSLLLETEAKSTSGALVLARFPHRVFDHAEYRMTLSALPPELQAAEKAGTVERVTLQSKETFAAISAAAFQCTREDSYSNFISTSDQRRGYLFRWNGEAVGTFVLSNEEQDETFIYGVTIAPAYQGQGLGGHMMRHAVEMALQNTAKALIEVDSQNPAALALYRHCGFQVSFQVDYHRVAI